MEFLSLSFDFEKQLLLSLIDSHSLTRARVFPLFSLRVLYTPLSLLGTVLYAVCSMLVGSYRARSPISMHAQHFH